MLALDDPTCAHCSSPAGPNAAVISARTLFAELLNASFVVRTHLKPDVGRAETQLHTALTDVQVVVIDAEVSCDDELVRSACFRATRQSIPIVVIGGNGDRMLRAAWIERGAAAFIDDDATMASISEMIDQLAQGQTIIGVSVRESLLSELRLKRTRNQERFAAFESLTKREEDVLRLLANGVAPEDVARTNYVSVNTVRTQIRGILAKLDTTSVVSAVALAYRTGWLEADLAL